MSIGHCTIQQLDDKLECGSVWERIIMISSDNVVWMTYKITEQSVWHACPYVQLCGENKWLLTRQYPVCICLAQCHSSRRLTRPSHQQQSEWPISHYFLHHHTPKIATSKVQLALNKHKHIDCLLIHTVGRFSIASINCELRIFPALTIHPQT